MSTDPKHKSRAQMIKNGRGSEGEKDENKSNDCCFSKVCNVFLMLDSNDRTTDISVKLYAFASCHDLYCYLDHSCVIYRSPFAFCLLLITIMNDVALFTN